MIRLARQARVMAEATQAFLSRLGLAAGFACLDVDCGDGQVTIAMTDVAGPSGCTVGVDIDAEALQLECPGGLPAGATA